MKKILLAIAISICSIQMSHSQEEDGVVSLALPIRNSLTFNQYAINPTFSFVRQQNKYISITNKREWVQFEDAPQTYLASFSGRFSENSGLGIGLFQQNYGVLTTFGGIANFAYNARLNRDSNLTFGLNVGAYKSGINSANVVTNFPDPALDNIPSNFLVTINPGINYGTGFMDFGVSINNLALYNSSNLIGDNPEQIIQAHIMYTGYTYAPGFFDESKFSALIRSEFKKEKTVVSGVAMITIPKGIWAQVGYNNLYGASGGLGINITKEIAIEYNFEKALGDLTDFGPSHEITLAYRFKNNENYDYGSDDEISGLISGEKRRKPVSKISKAQAEANRKLAAETRAQAKLDAIALEEAKAQKEAQAKLDAEIKREIEAEAQKEAEAQAKIDAENKIKSDEKAKEEAEAARLAAEIQAKEVAEAKAKIAAENKKKAEARAKEEAEAAKLAAKAEAEKQARIQAENKAKEEVKAKVEAAKKLAEEARLKAEADEKAKLSEQLRLKAEEDAKTKLEAETKAKADAAKLAEEARLKAEDQARKDALALEQADAAKLAAEEKAKKDAEAQAKADAESEAELVLNPTDDIAKSMSSIEKIANEAEAKQTELLNKYSAAIAVKNKDLKDLKEENDLSDKGIFMEPKPFKSLTAENNALESLKVNLDQIIAIRNDRIKELERLYDERLEIVPLVNDEVNLYYQRSIKKLKSEQAQAMQTKSNLVSTLNDINIATEFERKRRIKRAAFDSEQDRYQQDRAALSIIKQNTNLSSTPFKTEDFDFGEEQSSNIQILKNVKNVTNGYYVVLAVHSDVEKRNDFVTKVVSSGRTNVDFFYDVNTSKYYIYYEKYESIEEANEALKLKGNRPYNTKMSLVKIEN